ncbi:MAG: 3-hydroxyacyl-CoA dehydrogenase NAD-binding domain-containing protein [Solirubrobacterales bacterium]
MPDEKIAVIGSGAIACGVAAVATKTGEVKLLARSEESAERARSTVATNLERMGDEAGPGEVTVTTDPADLAGSSYFIEAVAADLDVKSEVFEQVLPQVGGDAILATTTSSLSVGELASASGIPERFAGLVAHPLEVLGHRAAGPLGRLRASGQELYLPGLGGHGGHAAGDGSGSDYGDLLVRHGAGGYTTPGEVTVTTDPADLAGSTYFIEAVAEDLDVKSEVFEQVLPQVGGDAILATTTSSLSVGEPEGSLKVL